MKKPKNYRTVPPYIVNKIKWFEGNEFVVAVLVRITGAELAKGPYRHIGVDFVDGQVVYEKSFMPSEERGKYSEVNRVGKEIKRKDLPKVTKTFYVEVPNFGDWSNGSHTISNDREVYQIEHVHPREVELEVTIISEAEINNDKLITIKFSTSEVISSAADDFLSSTLFNINLLYENVGDFDVYKTDTNFMQYLDTLQISWEILPPGERRANIEKITQGVRSLDSEKIKSVIERYVVLEKLRPKSFIKGSNGFRRYFGALFEDDLVAFENIEYGNAMYIMRDNWKELSQLSRIDLLKSRNGEFIRIVHGKGWEANVEGNINKIRKIKRNSLL